ncbi:delta-sarcoglycan [Galendromus occidentalis]|uniref:Delta-sarcoglycan n=1 Tax=Galendromus occidentalis TaxID=34638 RepID=A0AAJ7L7N6_9ACAR|nr:delta-sarcoglycan [Galendromus occidentalis]
MTETSKMSQASDAVHHLLVVHQDHAGQSMTVPARTSTIYARDPRAFMNLKIGVTGIRKKYLFILLISLCWLVSINILMTFLISKAVRFSFHGMGSLNVNDKSLRSDNAVNFLNGLAVRSIHSRLESPLFVHSAANITLASKGTIPRFPSSFMTIAPRHLGVMADTFTVHNTDGKQIFHATGEHSRISAHTLKIKGSGGIRVQGAVQSSALRNRDGLRVESSTRKLLVSGPEGVSLGSTSGSIFFESYGNMTLTSARGKITFSASAVIMDNIRSPIPSKSGTPYSGIYQLCICATGTLFLASPAATCRTDAHVCGVTSVPL